MNEQPIPISFFEHLENVKKEIAGKETLLFLDYDGTLTPIVDTPDQAIISGPMRETVSRVSQKIKTAVVSGRATDDVRGKVNLNGRLYYAGSHGFEIIDPEGNVTVNEEAAKVRGLIDTVHQELSGMVVGIPGALIEHVKYTISAHYRLVSDKDFPRIEQAVDAVLAKYPALRKTSGKKVFEIRPRIDWDKGKAVEWILRHLKFDAGRNVAVYIGDDTTDEDAFRVLEGKGFGILVAQPPRGSAAKYVIKDTAEVKTTLEFFLNCTCDL